VADRGAQRSSQACRSLHSSAGSATSPGSSGIDALTRPRIQALAKRRDRGQQFDPRDALKKVSPRSFSTASPAKAEKKEEKKAPKAANKASK